jgi:hypothetical protein
LGDHPAGSPQRLKKEVDDTADHHAFQLQSWPALAEVDTRWRGSFGYLTAIVEKEGEDVRIPLCRIEYLGDDNAWGFAISYLARRPVPLGMGGIASQGRSDLNSVHGSALLT